uniref:Gamma-glutamylcyclotransferase family protein n=1 Tax=Salix viminalis TaxID=40686 RepID=A0A6N2KPC0_SALVM
MGVEDLIKSEDAVLYGVYRTVEHYPLVCGPYRVPFLLNLPDAAGGCPGSTNWRGTSRGHYERLPIKVEPINGGDAAFGVEAYYGHRSYATEMWKRSGKRGYGVYGEKEAKGYVKRKDRPQNMNFLEQINVFVSSCSDN